VATWVLEREVFSDGDQALADAVLEADGQVLEWKDEWWLDGRWPKLRGPVVFHGSLANADRIARELPWKPGAFCATERFACSAWWPAVADRLVASSYLVTTVSDLVEKGPPVEFGDRVFVRPDSPLKPFSGRVLGHDQVSLLTLDHGFYYDDEQLPVVVAPAIEIGAEWRFVVAAGRIVTGSGYTAEGRSASESVPPEHAAWLCAADVVAELDDPEPVFIVDVAELHGEMRVLELNPFSGADLYNCNRQAVVDAVHALVN